MALNLKKGDKVNLAVAGKTPTAFIFGLGWNPPVGVKIKPDCDVVWLPRRADGTIVEENVCFFNQMDVGCARLSGDSRDGEGTLDEASLDPIFRNTNGEGTEDDERLALDLTAIPAEIDSADIIVTIYEAAQRGQSFGDLMMAYMRMEDPSGLVQSMRFDLTKDELFAEAGACFARMKRRGPAWTVEAVGEAGPQWTLESLLA